MIKILAIEKHKEAEIDLLCHKYIERINKFFPCKLEIIAAAKGNEFQKQQTKETELIQKNIKPTDIVVVCDERGKSYSSISFANLIEQQTATLRGNLIFAIGGAYGFTSDFLQKNNKLKISDFVLPHHLARLVLCEQIYRAYNILHNTEYHHK